MLSRHYNSLGLIICYFLLTLCLVSYFVLNPDQHPRSIKCRLPYVIHMRKHPRLSGLVLCICGQPGCKARKLSVYMIKVADFTETHIYVIR